MTESARQDILLIEDNPADVYLTKEAVAACGNDLRLWLVPNGRDALTFLRKEGAYLHVPPLDLILLDLNLPHLHGHKVLAELRCMPEYQATPVVIFSSAHKELEEERCVQLGANGYVQKPTSLDAFFAAIKTIVETWLRPSSS